MHVLVTGGAGYIGSVTTEKLLEAGHKVSIVDNLSEGHRQAIPPGSSLHQVDLLDKEKLQKVFLTESIDAVMHFAAKCLVGESMHNPGKYFYNNVQGGLNLLECMVKTGTKKIIFSSTCATYGIPEKLPMNESTPQNPVNPYGESKLMFEHILRWYNKLHGVAYVALRYFNAAGASKNFGEDHEPETHLIPNIFRTVSGRIPSLQIFGTDYPTKDGTCIRDYIHIEDLAQAHILALDYQKSTAFNLGTGTGFSVREIIDTAQKICGMPIRVIEAERREGDPPILVAAAEKAGQELGWNPQKADIKTIISDAWDWHSEHPNGYE